MKTVIAVLLIMLFVGSASASFEEHKGTRLKRIGEAELGLAEYKKCIEKSTSIAEVKNCDRANEKRRQERRKRLPLPKDS